MEDFLRGLGRILNYFQAGDIHLADPMCKLKNGIGENEGI